MFGLLLSCFLTGNPEETQPLAGSPRPLPNVALPAPGHADDAARLTGNARRLANILSRWESASNVCEEPSAAALQNLRMNITKELNGHAALAVEQLSGRVHANQLTRQFSWSIVVDDELLCLEARPNDETESLFYDSIRVWLDSRRFLATKMQTTDRRGRVVTSFLSFEPIDETKLVKVAFVPSANELDATIPPGPAELDQIGDPIDLSYVTPEMAAILKKWEESCDEMQTARIRFHCFVHNGLNQTREFDVELFHQSPDLNRLVVLTRSIKAKSEPNGIKGPNPQRWIEGLSWIVSRDLVIVMNDNEKKYQTYRNDKSIDAVSFAHVRRLCESCVPPCFIGIKADNLRRSWSMRVNEPESKFGNILISATPRTSRLRASFRECVIQFDPRTAQATAIRCIESTGCEKTYTIVDVNRNAPLPKDCFAPDLKKQGYERTEAGLRNLFGN